MVVTVLVAETALLAVLLGLLWYWIGRRVRPREDITTSVRDRIRRWRRRGHWIGLLNVTLLLLIIAESELLGPPTELTRWGLPAPVALGLTWGLIAGIGYLPAVGTLAGILPAARQTYERNLSWTALVISWGQYYLVVWVVLIASAVAGAVSYQYGGFPLAVMVSAFCLQLVLYAGNPTFSRLVRTVRAPTAAEADRLDTLCEMAGLSVDTYQVIDLEESVVMIETRGSPVYRSLLTTVATLEKGSDRHLESILAQSTALADLRFQFWRFVLNTVTIIPVIGLTLAGGGFPSTLATVGLVVIYIFGASQLQRVVYAADERAAAATAPETLHDAFEWFCAVNDTDGRESWLRQILRAEPSIAKRKQRLQSLIEAQNQESRSGKNR
jgi:hypothetical protein